MLIPNSSSDGKENEMTGVSSKAHEIDVDKNTARHFSPVELDVLCKRRRNTIHERGVYETPHKTFKHDSLTSPRIRYRKKLPKGSDGKEEMSAVENILGAKRISPRKLLVGTNGAYSSIGRSDIGVYKYGFDGLIEKAENSEQNNNSVLVKSSPIKFNNRDQNSLPVNNSKDIYTHHFESVNNLAKKTELQASTSGLSDEHLRKLSTTRNAFSLDYVRGLQIKHYSRVESLGKELRSKNDEIVKMSKCVHEAKSRLMSELQKNNDLTSKLDESTELVSVLNVLVEDLQSEISDKEEIIHSKKNQLHDLENEMRRLINARDDEIRAKSLSLSESIRQYEELETRLNDETSLVARHLNTIADLTNLKSSIQSVNDRLQKDVDKASSEVEKLKAENKNMFDVVQKKSDTIDSLRAMIIEKDAARQVLAEKLDILSQELDDVQEEMMNLEAKQKETQSEVLEKTDLISSLEASVKKLENDLTYSMRENEANCEKAYDLSHEIAKLRSKEVELMNRNTLLQEQNDEKDRIISGDTRKLNELVDELNVKKSTIAKYKAKLSHDNESVGSKEFESSQIASLKSEIASAQQKTDKRIQEVAEQLYHQYSKKHEIKVSQLKAKYEGKLEEKEIEIEKANRSIQSLENQLRTEIKEKTYLLEAFDSKETNWSPRKRLRS